MHMTCGMMLHTMQLTRDILYTYRGKLVLDALLDNLLESGLNNATEVILTGCSGVLYQSLCVL